MSNEFLKNEDNKQEKKLFANKKANIALAIVGGALLVLIIGAAIFVNV